MGHVVVAMASLAILYLASVAVKMAYAARKKIAAGLDGKLRHRLRLDIHIDIFQSRRFRQMYRW